MFNIVLVHPEIPPDTGNIIRLAANTGCCLHLTADGQTLMQRAELTAAELEVEATQRLSAAERTRLMALLQKIYL